METLIIKETETSKITIDQKWQSVSCTVYLNENDFSGISFGGNPFELKRSFTFTSKETLKTAIESAIQWVEDNQ